MNAANILNRALSRTLSRGKSRHVANCGVLTTLCLLGWPAHAVDGCQVLLCLAAPNWHAIPQCVPPIVQVLRDLAHGKALPRCDMSGAPNSATHTWADAPQFCPPQYIHMQSSEDIPRFTCDYVGAVSVTVNGSLFSRTWWTAGGDTSTEFSPAAKAQLGTWDTRFDEDYAAWLNTRQSPVASTALTE